MTSIQSMALFSGLAYRIKVLMCGAARFLPASSILVDDELAVCTVSEMSTAWY